MACYVRLQKQPRKHMELCSAIAYEGWERLGGTREAYRLREKQVYCHTGDCVSFWEGVSLAWRTWLFLDWTCSGGSLSVVL